MFSRFMGTRSHQKTSKKTSSVLARAARTTACVFEAVEARKLMSVALNNGVLTINGTNGSDKVTVQQLSGFMRVTENGFSTDWTNAEVRSFNVNLGNGNDSFNAYAVNETMTISGGAGNDTLSGGRSNDTIFGNSGNDELNGYDKGADFISGGSGTDEVVYYQHTSGVNVTLDNVANDGRYASNNAFSSVEFDNVLSDVENVTGSIYADFLFGSSANNTLNGYYGNDFVDGGAGNDGLKGGYGDDTLQGGDDNDWMWGGLGADLFNGGKGNDDVRYDTTDHTGVTARLATGGEYAVSYNNGMAGENDRIRGNVENLVGSYYRDYLYGNNLGNGISGMNGDDFISAGGGADWVNGNTGNDTLYGDGGNDFMWGEQGQDYISGGADWDDVRYDDSYHNSIGMGVNARLSMWYDNPAGNGHYGENDYIYSDNEALIGTKYGDVLSGNGYNNYIAGLDGDDYISGKGGHDTLDAGYGADWVWGDAGNDTLLGKDGAYGDHLDGGADYDTIERDRSSIWILIGGAPRSDAYSNGEVIR